MLTEEDVLTLLVAMLLRAEGDAGAERALADAKVIVRLGLWEVL